MKVMQEINRIINYKLDYFDILITALYNLCLERGVLAISEEQLKQYIANLREKAKNENISFSILESSSISLFVHRVVLDNQGFILYALKDNLNIIDIVNSRAYPADLLLFLFDGSLVENLRSNR